MTAMFTSIDHSQERLAMGMVNKEQDNHEDQTDLDPYRITKQENCDVSLSLAGLLLRK